MINKLIGEYFEQSKAQVNEWSEFAKQLGRGRECLGVEGAVSSPVRFTKWYIFKDAVKLSATNIKLKKP